MKMATKKTDEELFRIHAKRKIFADPRKRCCAGTFIALVMIVLGITVVSWVYADCGDYSQKCTACQQVKGDAL